MIDHPKEVSLDIFLESVNQQIRVREVNQARVWVRDEEVSQRIN